MPSSYVPIADLVEKLIDDMTSHRVAVMLDEVEAQDRLSADIQHRVRSEDPDVVAEMLLCLVDHIAYERAAAQIIPLGGPLTAAEITEDCA